MKHINSDTCEPINLYFNDINIADIAIAAYIPDNPDENGEGWADVIIVNSDNQAVMTPKWDELMTTRLLGYMRWTPLELG